MAHVAARTGMPIARAMPLAFPNDPRSDELLRQYMLGDAFLVAAFTDQIHLPEGTWIDYWTGERYVGPRDLTYCPPEGRGGPLFLRAGAIVPSWPDMDYVGHRPVDTLGLHVYPHGDSSFTLFEDDGVSFVYLQGAVAETSITCQATQGKTTLTIGPRAGSYQGMPTTRSFDVSIHLSSAPAQVIIDGKDATAAWRYDSDIGAVRLKVTEDPEKRLPVTITCLWA
jgi:alpha-glucosidase (family GH31 glycosyl hydrolase)